MRSGGRFGRELVGTHVVQATRAREHRENTVMARVALIDVSKTLTDRHRSAAEPGPSPRGGGRGATFSIRDLSLTIPDGQTLVILGPSGCGKTTLLKIIAGLIAPDSGAVRYDGVNVNDVRPGDRRIVMVFQNYALYPHFKSRTNVLSYFLFRKNTPALDALAAATYERTSELMGVKLAHLLDRKPATLAGGEKQRVALARCITRDAALFLVDEPFANLDQALREKYRVNLKILLRQFSITTVYVTHDHNEALILDLLAIMDRGRIEQVGTCQRDLHPAPKRVRGGVLEPPHRCAADQLHRRQVPAIGARLRERAGGCASRRRRGVDDAAIGPRPGNRLRHTEPPHEECDVVHAQAADGENFVIGEPAWLTFNRYHLFDKESGLRLRSHPDEESNRR
jgi:ABC-type sugar transport system ATPase subunit